ncbi:hypothetical protein H2199_004695 [Coniosporium tulheliwenetii]|uniref:Uncharacterized protein n=1 Tax=Coniosporium tulheliwenetii TaxID=3383036 RepID=A0ACC2Z428_9PEZI|nr:hypothetical protein H2199_004695 [Cladosporium sp. JES 115]
MSDEDHEEASYATIPPFFDAAFNGVFKEAAESAVRIKDTEMDVVCTFVDWLYRQKLPEDYDDDRIVGRIKMWWPDLLIGLYIFADFYNVPALRLEPMDKLYTEYASYDIYDPYAPPSCDKVAEIFARLSHTSPLCWFVVDVWANEVSSGFHHHADEEDILALGDLPKDFLDAFKAKTGVDFLSTARVEKDGEWAPYMTEQPDADDEDSGEEESGEAECGEEMLDELKSAKDFDLPERCEYH